MSKTMAQQLHTCLELGLLHILSDEAAERSNFIFSPLSIRVALGLVTASLRNPDQLPSSLSFLRSPTLEDLNTASAKLIHACRPSDDKNLLKISLVSGIWADQSLKLEPSFVEVAQSIYKAYINHVDFKTQFDEIRIEINDWIKKETAGLIKDFLPCGTPDENTDYVVANALYFKGNWMNEFECSETRVENFYLLDGSSHVEVPFMTCCYKNMFFSCFEDFKALRLSYKKDHQKGRRFSMILFLPHTRDGLIDLAKEMASSPNFINKHIPSAEVFVHLVKIPKFTVSSNFDLSDSLKKVGMGSDKLKAFHGATIEVDEKGTSAAAVTVYSDVEEDCGSSDDSPRPATEFIAEHPFMFAIREDASGAILFLGHIANPSI